MSDPAACLRTVLDVLRDSGFGDGWLAFDSLMSAVRFGDLGDDEDPLALAFVTGRAGHVDAVRQTFRVGRALRQAGLDAVDAGTTHCRVTLGDDSARREVSVQACWQPDDALALAPGLLVEGGVDAVYPLTEIPVGDTALPAPADPRKLLAATYGNSWGTQQRPYRVRARARLLGADVAGFGRHRRRWERFYRGLYGVTPPREPSRCGEWAAELERAQHADGLPLVVDVGCGNGRDTRHFADQGYEVIGLDYAAHALRAARDLLGEHSGHARLRSLDLYDLRSTLLFGAELAGADRAPALYARFVAHALEDDGRENLWRLGAMALRHGGRLYLEFRTHVDEAAAHVFEEHHRRYLHPDEVVAELKRHGGAVVHREEGHGLAPYLSEDPHICRLVVQWAK